MLNLNRDTRRQIASWYRSAMSLIGRRLPFPLKLRLARESTKFGYLLLSDGSFVFDSYLGQRRVHIDTQFPSDRSMLAGVYEADLWAIIQRYVQPGFVCFDIGANIGAVSLYLAERVGANGKVYAIEPGPKFARRLTENFSLNPDLRERTQILNMGLSNVPGTLFWEEDPQFPGNAYLFGSQGTEVPVETLDQVVEHKGITKLDFIKIDVEGMELEVLQGGIQALQKFRPMIFFETLMEFEQYRKANIRKQALDLLRDQRFTIYSVDACGNLSSASYPNLGSNCFAVPMSP